MDALSQLNDEVNQFTSDEIFRHHGSTCTTFSTGSVSSTSASDHGAESTASSGVATMSSTDHLPSQKDASPALAFESLQLNESIADSMTSSKTMTPVSNEPLATSSLELTPDSRSYSRASSVFGHGPKNMICVPLRMMVSQNRRRFQADGFNLDLTYITDRIIAMGYPADTAEAFYRNSMKHTVKFLETFHPEKYKVFNLRGQYAYDEKNFHYRVISYEMKDHHPPRLELMAPFCREVHDHLLADPTNIVAVHCKAGKGRTGVMICAYLYYINFFETPRQIMDYYSIIRTHNNKGVTIPSQRRYVYYFAHLRDKHLNYMPLKTELIGVYLEKPPRISGLIRRGALSLRVANGDVDVFHGHDLLLTNEQYDEEDELWQRNPVAVGDDSYNPDAPVPGHDIISRRCYGWTVPPNKRVFLEGDIRIDILKTSHIKPIPFFPGKDEKIGHIWFNTMFTCPGFCGGIYTHGDQAYPYHDNGADIVTVVNKPKVSTIGPLRELPKSNSVSEKREPKSTWMSSSMSSSPPCQPLRHEVPVNSPSESAEQTPPPKRFAHALTSEHRKSSKNAFRLNGVAKRFAEVLEPKKFHRHIVARSSAAQEAKCERWSSQDESSTNRSGLMDATQPARSSLDYTPESDMSNNEASGAALEDVEIEVRRPPGLNKHCPEESLKEMYPQGNAPRYNIEEMLRNAYRQNLIKDAYNDRRLSLPQEGNIIPKAEISEKMPPVGGPFCLVRKPHEHVMVYPVMEIDRLYKDKEVDTGLKMYVVTHCLDENCPGDTAMAESFINVTRKKQMEKDARKRENVKGKKYAEEARKAKIEKRQSGSALTADTSNRGDSDTNEEVDIPNCDPRFLDPHMKKFFFRQRITSVSRHPQVHHHCSAQIENIQRCQNVNCRQKSTFSNTDRPQIGSNDSEDNTGTTSVTQTNLLSTDNVVPAIHGRCATISATTAEDPRLQCNEIGGAKTIRSRSARCQTDKVTKKQSSTSNNSGIGGPEDSHPVDYSWASSSASSSCSSLMHIPRSNSSTDSDNGTIRRPLDSFGSQHTPQP
uniref:Phosphatidylinositol-3,4,5-trisphosphate 3-phosphatase n=1 Tax=Panagrellus redivivus TaxID=6233 RepID=A0A7E4V1B7_PANRE